MKTITFVTGNDEKFLTAEAACQQYGFALSRATYDIDEIQGEDAKIISLDKARKAFALVGAPVVINDDSWSFPGLNGFPGLYMKSMNHWLKPQDFLNLTKDLEDRRAIITQVIVYQDEHGSTVFSNDFENELIREARGNYGNAVQKIVCVPSDNGLTIAEAYDNNAAPADREVADGWRQFAEWYANNTLVSI